MCVFVIKGQETIKTWGSDLDLGHVTRFNPHFYDTSIKPERLVMVNWVLACYGYSCTQWVIWSPLALNAIFKENHMVNKKQQKQIHMSIKPNINSS
jgi:hypothetical protein